jgi:uncharacterized protein (DUF2252 family)
MRFRSLLGLLLVLATASMAPAQQRPYERIRRSAGPYLGEREPLGWPYRSYCMAQSPYALWTSGQDLFFTWCKTNAADWLADHDAITACHGNTSLAAFGSYPAQGPFGKLAFGIQSFDDSCRMPFQCELLQGLITLRLVAEQNRIDLDERAIDALWDALSEAYRASIASPRDATSVFAEDPWVARLLSADNPYTDCLDRYTSVGQFKRSIADADGKPREILRSAQDSADLLAGVLAEAVAKSPSLARQVRFVTREDFRASTRDIAQRTVLQNPMSPGAREFLVLLARPLHDVDHDVIFLLRQQIPSPAERASFAQRDARAPAERASADAQTMMEPPAYVSGFGRAGADSYTVQLFDPWSRALEERDIKDRDALLHLAQIWGGVTGLTHRQGGKEQIIVTRMTPDLAKTIKARADSYLQQLRLDFDKFSSDPSAHADADLVKQTLSADAAKP